MVSLPIVRVPLIQRLMAEPFKTLESPVEETKPRPSYELRGSATQASPQYGDGQNFEAKAGLDIAIDMDIEPAPEEGSVTRNLPSGPDVEFESPHLPPNYRRKDTRFRSFPSISTWSTRSSTSVTKRFRNAVGFVLQSDAQDEFIPNYRWLPILSGVTIPFSILLQIPALTERWYVRTEDNRTIDSRPNPSILLAGNILAMAAALTANICLIIRFLERHVKQMTIIALCLLSIHDVINVVIVTTFGVEHRSNSGFTYGKPFWLTTGSTLCSLFTTLTLLFDLYNTPEFSRSGSGLTRKQRSLVIIVMMLLCWIAFGGLVYSILMHLSFIDGLYFTVVSIEAIGFGDLKPTSSGARVFAIFYNSIGLLNIGLAISTTRETIIESFEHSYRRRAREVARRRHEYKRQKSMERAKKRAIERVLGEAGLPVYVPDPYRTSKMKLNHGALNLGQLSAVEEEAVRLTDGSNVEPGGGTTVTFGGTHALTPDLTQAHPATSYKENYKNFKKAILRQERREFTAKLAVAWTVFLTFWLIGAGIFSVTEKWDYGSSLYFCFVAFSTIGYGDMTPATPAGRSVFVLWALMGVAAMTILISVLSEAYSSRYKNVLSKGSFERAIKNFRRRRESSPPSHIIGSHPHSRSRSRDASPDRRYTHEHAKRDLEGLPAELLTHAKNFHEHIYYFLSSVNGNEPPPHTLRKLLDEIAESEQMDARLKREMMRDDNARKTLFIMSYESALRRMIDTAERAVALMSKMDLPSETMERTHESTARVHNSEGHVPRSFNVDSGLRFNFGDQKYRRRQVHLHPQGLESEPDLHSPRSSAESNVLVTQSYQKKG